LGFTHCAGISLTSCPGAIGPGRNGATKTQASMPIKNGSSLPKVARQSLAKQDLGAGIDTMNLEHRLRDIQTNRTTSATTALLPVCPQ
jgi:hypothetical protein